MANDAFLDELGGIVEMDVSRYDIDVRTDDGNEGFVKVFFVHAAGTEQTSMRSAGIAPLDCVGSHSGIIADFSLRRYSAQSRKFRLGTILGGYAVRQLTSLFYRLDNGANSGRMLGLL